MRHYRINPATGEKIWLPMDTKDLAEETETAVATLRKHAAKTAAIIKEHQAARDAILRDDMLSPKAQGEQITRAKLKMDAQAKALKQQRQEALDTLAAAHARGREPQGDSATQLLKFQQEEAAWRRAEKLKASGQDWTQVIRDAGQRGDVSMLAALRRELPAEVAGMNQMTPGYSTDLLKLVSAAEEPHVSDLERAIRTSEAQAEKLASNSMFNENVLGAAVENGRGEPGNHYLIDGDSQPVPLTEQGSAALRDLVN